jgi:hypothetical protein
MPPFSNSPLPISIFIRYRNIMSEENEETLAEKLTSQIEVAHWKILEEHNGRGALINVAEGLDLVSVAVDVAEDNVNSIRELMTSGQLARPNNDQITAWNKEEAEDLRFNFLIIQPYVLCQVIKEEE